MHPRIIFTAVHDATRAGSRRAVPWLRVGGPAALLAVWLCGCSAGRIRPPRGVPPVERTMEVTAYCNCGACTGWRRTGWLRRPVIATGPRAGQPKAIGVTASGTRARHGTVAADTTRYPFGTVVHVPGYGYGRVEDRGGAIRGDKLDLWYPTHRAARQWGRQQVRVQIWLPPEP